MTTATASVSSTVKRLRRSQTELVAIDDAIVTAVTTEHPVTLRGVYYRVVSAGAVEKTEAGYRLVGRQLLKLRRDGTVPYSSITDGTRWITKPRSYTGTEQALNDVASSYRRSLWHDQQAEVHVFTEKDAISGVLLPVTEQWDVPLGVLRGYSSESFAHSVAEAIYYAIDVADKDDVYVYQLGDHDPSGLDAWRAFTATVRGFLDDKFRHDGYGLDSDPWVHFERLAVTPDQISELELPTRPTKQSDTRARGFRGESVEVDAIPPSTLRTILTNALEQHINPHALQINRMVEDQERAGLAALAGGWAS